ncbi:4-hydroxyphenylpyruvate dioxygenase [Micromonospora sp. NPDC005413]|uniref:4-hydroxyphenylpyruvate dioxygenase n=1 Tax=Micromonospora sp. NPDC005413 TaxID=3154563 RepID=UPI0033B0E3B2
MGSSVFSDLAVHHVEFHVTDAVWTARELAAQYGFAVVGSRRAEDHVSVALHQGSTVLVVTEGLADAHPASLYVQQHGDGVADLAMRTADAKAAFEVAVSRGARAVVEPAARDGFVTATVGGFGDVTHTFVQPPEGSAGPVLPGLTPGLPDAGPAPGLGVVDHLAVCLEAGTLDSTVDFYRTVLNFDVTFEEHILVGNQAMFSKVVQSPSRLVTLTLIEPDVAAAAGQIDDFLKGHGGPGVQHVALCSADIVSSISALTDRGVDFLRTPDTYYDLLGQRLDLARYDVDQLQARNILVDEDHDGQLFQIFARSTHPRRTFFFEVIERLGARTFGSGNIRALYEAVEAERTKTHDVL